MIMDSRIPKKTHKKEYGSAFLLDQDKAHRIVGILEDGFNALQLQFQPTYSIDLWQRSRSTLASIEAVLKLDNTIRDPIKSLRIEASDSDWQSSISLRTDITFKVDEIFFLGNISIYVESSDLQMAQQIFLDLEEQVKRTFLDDWVYKLKIKFPGFFLMTSLSIFMGSLISIASGNRTPDILSPQKLEALLDSASKAETSEEKINFIFELTRQELEQRVSDNSNPNGGSLMNWQSLFVILPILIIIVCIYYAVSKCYPCGIFLWGDYREYFKRLVDRRNMLWTVVILTIVLGTITNFL
ncbi:MAG: hypothetical protein F6K30_18825 [Cyanothece sp. SIO2G6]|nr:hypothetical protein [Cyanothece sp. SIO2G6]